MKTRKKPSRNKSRNPKLASSAATVSRHFKGVPVGSLVSTGRQYPITARVDLQWALDEVLGSYPASKQLGIHSEYSIEAVTFSHLLGTGYSKVRIGPLEFDEVDAGDAEPVRCVRRALWLAKNGPFPFAVVVSAAPKYESSGTNIDVVVPPGEQGAKLARKIMDAIDERVRRACAYRGRVLSLAASERLGSLGSIRVHKLRQVTREQLILPSKTISLLDRNVMGFVQQRERLKELGLPVKKGLLFYGPPGTGKTHTIHYLATSLPSHSTLLISGEAVGLLEHYFQLARFLQPSIVVIEDVDLIARARERMNSACEEVMLNKLLNEMDGLREDAEILFILTTNHPQQLEGALASRPGRIDQAIEFPLPDDESRRRLVRLYSCGLEVRPELADMIARRTDGASPALIKELMRRSAQYLLSDGEGELDTEHVDAAMQEMLFDGGTLNARLLGGPALVRPN